MKTTLLTVVGAVGGAIAAAFGGWDEALTTLLICMVIDYITGLVVAGVFHNSPKSTSGALESNAGLKGLFRKAAMLLFVLIGHRLDLAMGTSYVKDAVCIGFIANELISVVENAGLMGLPIPSIITDAIDILNQKKEEK